LKAEGRRQKAKGKSTRSNFCLLPFAFCLLPFLVPASARAADGLYGRFDGDLELQVSAGTAFAEGGPSLAAGFAALYLSTVGVYVQYTDALGSGGPLVARSVATGLHVAPLFLARYASNGERGPAHLDLFLDSFAFEVGTFWDQPRGGAWASRPGLELALGVAVPILGRATGPYVGLRAALRWRDADLASPGGADVLDRGALLSLTLGWHHVVLTHLVDAGDGPPR
jgi:hypothetical protein